MGLSGRKAKQRIGKDPRNLAWADDASRFGQAYLAKFGWDSSKGLGTSGEGRTTAVKASQKLDMLGIGMQHQNNPDGIAWRQNRDFENLLRRLNEGTNDADAIGSFHKARESESLGGEEEAANGSGSLEKAMDGDNDNDERDVRTAKKEKRKTEKRKAVENEDEEGPDKKERKKRKKSRDGSVAAPESKSEPEPPPPPKAPAHESGPGFTAIPAVAAATATATATVAAPVPVRAPPRTHRARVIAAKRMAASNSTALAEILGIPSSAASSSSTHPSAAATPFRTPTATPVPDLAAAPAPAPAATAAAVAEAEAPLQRLTTSAQSVGDYFKAKLGAKMNGAPRPSSALAGAGAGASARDDGDGDRDGRAGLGLRGGGASRERLLLTDRLDGERVRGGIGASLSSSRLAAMFMPGQCATPVAAGEVDELVVTRDASDGQEDERRKRRGEKKRAKEERRKEKEERRRKRAEAEAGQVDGAVVDPPDGGPPPDGGTKKKKRREPEAPDGYLEDAHSPPGADGMEAIPVTKKQKRGNKDKKSAKHRIPEE